MLAHALGTWKTNLYELGPAGTAAIKELESGTGDTPFLFPTYTALALRWQPESTDCPSLHGVH